MIRIIRKHPSFRRGNKRAWRKLVLVPAAGCVMALGSCEQSHSSPPPQVPITDTIPIGDGLKVIAFAVLGVGVLGVLGRLLK